MIKLVLFGIYMIIATNTMAEWVYFSVDSNNQTSYFYDNTRIKKAGDTALVWLRVRDHESSPIFKKFGILSQKHHAKINCKDNWWQWIQTNFFRDPNWRYTIHSKNVRNPNKIPISSNTPMGKLATIVCKEMIHM